MKSMPHFQAAAFNLHTTRMTLLLALAAATAHADPAGFGIGLETVLILHGTENWQTILLGSVLVLIGLFLVVFGGNGSYLALYANGFLSVSSLASLLTWNVEPASGYTQRAALYMAVYFISGFVGGLVFGFLPFLGHLFACAYYGLILGIELLCLSSGGLFTSILGRQLFLVPFTITALLVSVYHPKHVLGAMAGLSCPFVVALGIDLWAQTGLIEGVAGFMTLSESGAEASARYVFDQPKQFIVACSLVFGVVAGGLQYRVAVTRFGKGPQLGLEAGNAAVFVRAS